MILWIAGIWGAIDRRPVHLVGYDSLMSRFIHLNYCRLATADAETVRFLF